MTARTKLSELDGLLAEMDYPVDRTAVLDRYGEVTLVLAEGEERLGDTLEHSTQERFHSGDELRGEIMQFLPRNAVGEPFQSDGDA
jgi:hypothetical protein